MSGHRRSVRLAAADYGAPGLYFVTVVAARRAPLFGRLHRGRVALSDAGQIAHDEWLRTGDLRASVVVDAFVIMPDHVHLLFGITEAPTHNAQCRRGTACCALVRRGTEARITHTVGEKADPGSGPGMTG